MEEKLTVAEIAKIYEKEVDEHKKSLEDISDVDQLLKMEQDTLKEQDEYTEVLNKKIYKLPAKMTWNEREYTINQIGKKIVGLLNKLEIQFSYTLGYWQVGRFWNHPVVKVPYHMMDTTLRILGNDMKFKGLQEWEDILIINEFFKGTNDEYSKDLMKNILIANKHNNIVDRLQVLQPVKDSK